MNFIGKISNSSCPRRCLHSKIDLQIIQFLNLEQIEQIFELSLSSIEHTSILDDLLLRMIHARRVFPSH